MTQQQRSREFMYQNRFSADLYQTYCFQRVNGIKLDKERKQKYCPKCMPHDSTFNQSNRHEFVLIFLLNMARMSVNQIEQINN